MGEPANEPSPPSEAAQRVAEALIAGQTPPADARAALTPEEAAEVAALARTAHLTGLILRQPEPDPAAQENALAKARDALQGRTPLTTPDDVPSRWRGWWERLLQRRNGE